MLLSSEEIATSTQWLLDHASPPVKYLTHKHILKASPNSPHMQELWNRVEESRDVQAIFAKQQDDGSWFSGGPWGPRGYRQQTGRGYTVSRPKFVTTAWILPFLGDMGFTIADERIKKSCEHILHEVGFSKSCPEQPQEAGNCCGLASIPLRALASVGMASDERLVGAWKRLTLCQRPDGGWLNPRHLAESPHPSTTKGRWPWDRSCVWGSFFATHTLFYAEQTPYHHAFPAACEFLVWHLAQKDPGQIQTWVYHGHNIVKELLMFSESGLDMQVPPIQTLLTWVKGYYHQHEGMFRAHEMPHGNFVRHISGMMKTFEQHHGGHYWTAIAKASVPVVRYQLYHVIEDDWLTYYLTRVALNMAA